MTYIGHKINTQKSLTFLYTNNEKSKRVIKESISFTIAAQRIKYPGINLPKETKELYTENYKTLMKEIKDDINRWRDISCSWVGRIKIVKTTILPNTIYRFNVIPLTYQWHFSQNKNKNFTIRMETQKTLIAKAVLRKKHRAGGINFPDFRLYYKAIVIKTVWYWHQKNRNIDQWTKIETPEINLCPYSYLIFYKGGKNIQWGKDSLFSK